MVYLLGCDHYLQDYDLQDFMEEIRKMEHELKAKFYSIIEEIIKSKKINFIGEECKPGQKTIPRALASESNLSYAEIDMSAESVSNKESRRTTKRRGMMRGQDVMSFARNIWSKEYMQKSNVTTNKLIVCGALHLNGLSTKFSKHEVRFWFET